ncbi:MAG TPA: hypothetical protein VE593_04785 [Nitrososphaeraceae archaeon]|nr:hypothetical protein [Nitrososphaeraceae archaeon]
MGCMNKEACPTLFIHNLLEWIMGDLKGKSLENREPEMILNKGKTTCSRSC